MRRDDEELPAGSRVLITGAGGFLGSRLAEKFAGRSDLEITCLVRRKLPERIAKLGLRVVTGGMLDQASVEEASRGQDYVFHCAYDPNEPESNVVGTKLLLEACAGEDIRRFVHISTFAVYQPFPDGEINEDTADGDRSIPYVDVKLRTEAMVLDYAAHRNVPATIIQPAIVYGPHCWVWTKAPADLLLKGNVLLPDNGRGICNLVFVDDLVQAMVRAAVSPAAICKRFVVAGDDRLTWMDYFRALASALGVPPPLEGSPRLLDEQFARANKVRLRGSASTLPARLISKFSRLGARLLGAFSGKPSYALPLPDLTSNFLCYGRVDSERARALLGYKPRIKLEEGLGLTRHYYEREFALKAG